MRVFNHIKGFFNEIHMKKRFFLGLLTLIVANSLFAQNHENTFPIHKAAFSKMDLKEINTSHLEIRPILSADGNTLYFSRRKNCGRWRRKKNQDIYMAHRDPATGNWGEIERLGDQLNNNRWNAVASVNPSGKELVLFNTYKKMENVPLVRSVKEGGSWRTPQEIHIQGYENFSPYSDFFVDFKQRVLLMAIEPYETNGEQDLFVSFPDGENGWTKPLNMGPVVNSEKSDFAPFIGADGKTLFFSSYGHFTHGGSDIFISVRLDDSWTNWSTPVNLGPEINSIGDENYFFIDQKFENLYYSSQKAGENQGNIIRVMLPEDFIAINGPILANLKKEEIQKIMDSGNYIVSQNGRTTNSEGDTIISFKENGTLPILGDSTAVSTVGKMPNETNEGMSERFDESSPMAAVKSLLSAEAASVLEYLKRELPGTDFSISLKGDTTEYKLVADILFGFNSINVSEEYQQRLNIIANVLKNKEDLKVQLVGHTDNIGSEEVNQRVARLRVNNVLLYLSNRGVNGSRIEVVGAGKSTPVAPNETNGGRSLNRRVETIIRFIEDQ